jgi:eukaryotic-like serine/threonine-protein kinase
MDITPSVMAFVDEDARRRFELAWREGRPLPIADFLPSPDQTSYLGTLLELIHIELEFAWKDWKRAADAGDTQVEQPARVETYLERFPCLGQPRIVRQLVQQEFQVRHRHGEAPAPGEFEARFPTLLLSGEEITVPRRPSVAGEPPLVPGYEILGELGRGGMGVVYKARQLSLQRLVALKMILDVGRAGQEDLARFRMEGEAAAHLQHPTIVQIHEVGQEQGRPYFALEYVEGGSLAQRLDRTPQPPRAAAEMVQTLARAIHHAHQRGIVHRDLKPANVLLTADGTPKITDFGLAKRLDQGDGQTRTGTVLGTPSYMAPEQAGGKVKEIGPAVDVYALGAILYEMLTGRPPFRGESPLDTMQQILSNEPAPPSRIQPKLPQDVETICLKCLAKEPRKRYASAAELADDLGRFLANEPIRARRIGPVGRLVRWCRRQPALAATLAAAVVLIATVAGIGFWRVVEERDHVREERDRVVRERDRAEANLYRALVGEATAQMEARPTGWSWKALANLRMAAQLHVEERNLAELRELAVQCMGSSYSSMRLHPEWADHARKPSPVSTVAISADKRLAVSGSNDGTVRVWALPEGRLLAELTGHGKWVRGVAFHPDGRQVASASADGTVRVWDLDPLTRPTPGQASVRVLNLCGAPFSLVGEVSAVAFSPDGHWLAAGCTDGSVRLLPSGPNRDPSKPPLRKLTGHSNGVTCLAFFPSGLQLVTGSLDKTLRFWDLSIDKSVETRPLRNTATTLAVSPDGRTLVWADQESYGFGALRLPEQYLFGDAQLHTDVVTQVCCDSQQRVLSASRDGTLKLWGGHRGVVLLAVGQADAGAVLSAALSQDGTWAAAGYEDGRVRLWELREPPQRGLVGTNAQRGVFASQDLRLIGQDEVFDFAAGIHPPGKRYTPAAVPAIATHPGGRFLACGTNRGDLYVWDRDRSRAVVEWAGHSQRVTSLASSPDGQRLASASADGLVKLWRWDTGRLDQSLTPGVGGLHAVAWSLDGRRLAATGTRGVVLWDLEGDSRAQLLSEHARTSSGVAFSADAIAFCGPTDNSVEVRKIGSGETLHTLRGHTAEVGALAFSPDGRWLASASRDATVQLWDMATGRKGPKLEHRTDVSHWLSFDPKGRYLVGGTGGSSLVWDIRSPATLPAAWLQAGPGNNAECGQFTPDGSALLEGTGSGAVQSWAVADIEAKRAEVKGPAHPVILQGNSVLAPGGHITTVWEIAASRDGRWVATASHDRTVKLWDGRTMKLVRTLTGHTESLWTVALSADGKYVASGSFGGRVKLHETATGQEVGLKGQGHSKLISALAFHPTRPLLASASDDGSVRLWDVAARRELGVLHQFHGHLICGLAFRPDGNWLAASCGNHTVALWKMDAGTVLPAAPDRFLTDHTAAVWGIGFSPDGRYLASGSDQGVIVLWDGATFEKVVTLRGGTRQIRGISFSHDGRLLAGAAYAGPTIVWDLPVLRQSLREIDLDW